MYTQKKQQQSSIAFKSLDHGGIGLKNKFLENKSGPIFLRLAVYSKILPTNLMACYQPSILFIDHIWGETVY